jgi:hypothetical protein
LAVGSRGRMGMQEVEVEPSLGGSHRAMAT